MAGKWGSQVARSGNGEGTIRKRRDGRWEARVVLPNGRRKSLYGKTRQEVARLRNEVIQQRKSGLPVLTERQTVGEYLLSWLATTRHSVEPSSYLRYELEVRRRLIPHVGRYILAKLTAQQMQLHYGRLLEEGCSRAAVRRAHAVFHTAPVMRCCWVCCSRTCWTAWMFRVQTGAR
jgi:hypothetical protein